MALQTSALIFKVTRHPTELIAPSKHTPHELKLLSEIDELKGLHCHIPSAQFFKYNPSMEGKDPVQIVRQALAKTLVLYYPLAGRLRQGHNGKLFVDCNEEGVLFIEADADVTLEQFGFDFLPPFPCFDELLYNVPGSDGMVDCPLLLLQVTRLKCGSFILAARMNHIVIDGVGIAQFMMAMGEMACGAPKPSILPVWHRELLCARDPPRVTRIHREFDYLAHKKSILEHHHRSFFFGPKDIDAIRGLLPYHLAQSSSSFEVLTSFLWRCRTKALYWQDQDQDQEVRLLGIVSARYGRCKFNPPLPEGYYGNAFVFPAAVTTVGNLCCQPFEYALELVKKAKDEATEEYVHSLVDLMAIKGRPCFTKLGSFMVSDLSKASSMNVDFGWGKPIFYGVAEGGLGEIPGVSFCFPFTNSKGEQGRVVLICLPLDAMERFEKELSYTLKIENNNAMLMSNL